MAMDGLSDMGSVVIRGYIHTFAGIGVPIGGR
jgi:hypothetical protein